MLPVHVHVAENKTENGSARPILKLRAMIEQPKDPAHLLRVLRRLSTAPMSIQLDATSGMSMCAFFARAAG